MRHVWPAIVGVVLVLAATRPAAAQLRTQVVATGLSSPIAFVPDPTSATRFFVVQQNGLIRVLDGGALLAVPLLDLRGVVRFTGEQGLLGMAFAPDAATTGRFFVNFSNQAGDTVVARFRRSPATALTVDPATRFDLRWPDGQPFIDQPESNHNGGHLAFGPDHLLYVGLGDGGGGNDPRNNSQLPSTLLGKMLRIDVNVADTHPTGYVVPADNPFLDGQPIAALGEIWSFGLRNPWRYSFDDVGAGATGALIIGDVGQGAREEVDYEPAGTGGRNYGWRIREGTVPTPGVPATPPAFLPLVDPLFDYVHAFGRAVTGGYVYRGAALPPAYRGRYFVADFVSSRVASVGLSVNPATGQASVTDVVEHTAELSAAGPLGGVSSFGRDAAGELYLVTFAGRVLKIVPDNVPGPPGSLSASVAGQTVTLGWTPPSSGAAATGFRLEAGSTSGGSDVAAVALGPVTGLTVGGVPDGTYFVRVRGERQGALGPPSNEVVVVVNAGCTGPPAAPSGLAASVTGTVVVLTFSAAPGASSHVVEAGSSAGQTDLALLGVGSATRLEVQAPPGRYHVRARGVNPCNTGPPSNEILVVVP